MRTLQGPARIATYLGVGMTLFGFVLIGLAWSRAADLDFIQGQFPYALSGGLGGLGLIIGGMAVLAIQTQRTVTAQRARQMARLQDEVDALIRHLVKPGPGELIEDETIIDVGAQTVIRTIDRRPAVAPQGQAVDPGLGPDDRTVPPGGFAPSPRTAQEQTDAIPVEQEAPASVATLDRDAEATGEEVWAPRHDDRSTDEHEKIAALLRDVSGVGPAKQAEIAEHFGSARALRLASVDELARVPGVSRTLADRIAGALR
jgi:hypothetical protein